jgi:hypothetical protein
VDKRALEIDKEKHANVFAAWDQVRPVSAEKREEIQKQVFRTPPHRCSKNRCSEPPHSGVPKTGVQDPSTQVFQKQVFRTPPHRCSKNRCSVPISAWSHRAGEASIEGEPSGVGEEAGREMAMLY